MLAKEISITLSYVTALFLIGFTLLSSLPLVYAQTKEEALQTQIFLAKSTYALEQTKENRSALLLAYEVFLQEVCMRDLLRSADYTPYQLSATCEENIDALIELDHDNPIAVCARDGIDAKSCRRASAMRITKVRIGTSLSDLPKSNREVRRRNFEKPAVKKAREKLESEPSYENARALENLFREELSEACSKTDVERIPEGELIRIERSNRPKNEAENAIRQFLVEKGEISPDEMVEKRETDSDRIFRVRVISRSCSQQVEELLRIYPDSPLALCYRDGFFSPSCVDAKRRDTERYRVSDPGALQPRKNPSIGRF